MLRGRSAPDRARRRRALLRFGVVAAVLALVLSVVGTTLAQDGAPYTATDPKSPEGDRIQDLYKLIFWMGVVVFVLVQFLIVYTAMRFKRNRSHTQRPNQVHGHRTLEITWTVIPAIVLLIIAVPTISTIYQTYADAADTDDAMVIEVYGKQWWWEVHYPGMGAPDAEGNPTAVVTANEIRIPEDQNVVFKLYSNNVIHSFWIPEMTGRMDVIPGHERRLSITPTESGTYYGECTEFCGVAHAWMRFVVKVQPQAEFDTWVTAMTAGPDTPTAAWVPNGDVTQTPAEFAVCLQCHVIQGVNSAGVGTEGGLQQGIYSDPTSLAAAPNLTMLGCRDTLAAGLLENTPENLALWLLNPGHVKEGNYMYAVGQGVKNQDDPESAGYRVSPDDIPNLVGYLESLHPAAGCPDAGAANGNMNTDQLAPNAQPVGTPEPVEGAAGAGATPGAETPGAATPVAGATPVAAGAAGAAQVSLEGGDLYFAPTALTVAQGGTISLTNVGQLPHNFAIEGYNDTTPVDMPNGETVDWVVPNDLAPGTYVFYCAIPGHRQAMNGTITITAP